MAIGLLAARIVLASVFLTAGVAKLADREGSREAITAFGAPRSLARPLSALLPLVELTAAALLIPATTVRWGALVALTLLLLFMAGIARSMVRGEAPDCHCFGQLHSAPAGPKTLGRNAGLAAVAAFAAIAAWRHPGPSMVGWIGTLTTERAVELAAGVVLAGGLIAGATFMAQLLRQNGRLLLRIEALEGALAGHGPPPARGPGLHVGTPAPEFLLAGVHGETTTLEALRAPDKPVLLLFTDSNCGPCNALMPEIARWQRDHSDLVIALIGSGSADKNSAKAREHGILNLLLQKDREVSAAYRAEVTPSAVSVTAGGLIASPVAAGPDAIRALLLAPLAATQPGTRVNGRPPAAPRPRQLPVGTPAPNALLHDLSGRPTNLGDALRGRDTLLLFWNPRCGFCQRMLPALREWESERSPDAPALVLVSTGSPDDNESMQLRSTVLSEERFGAGLSFGATGTPSGLLVGADGRIASDLAVGADDVFAIANGSRSEAQPRLIAVRPSGRDRAHPRPRPSDSD
jgi:thiol-disulfide isomerase/thioredoxin/uncharacterized membrane protein YphA (DoxX/SURF4 family)